MKLEHYLKKVNINLLPLPELSHDEKVKFLRQIYFAHVKTFPYSNFGLRELANQHPIQRNLKFFSYNGLLKTKEGGYCYQSAALMFDALSQLGFAPQFHEAYILLGAPVNDPAVRTLPATHVLLTVNIDDKKFFLDPGLGASAPRFPILISAEEDIVEQDSDTYKLSQVDNVYVLQKKTSQGWFRLMQTDLVPLSRNRIEMNLLKLEQYPGKISIRDSRTLVGIITEHGRKSLMWEEQLKQIKFTQQEGNQPSGSNIVTAEEAIDVLAEHFNIHNITQEQLRFYCSPSSTPCPKRRWSVDLPLNESKLKAMENNLDWEESEFVLGA